MYVCMCVYVFVCVCVCIDLPQPQKPFPKATHGDLGEDVEAERQHGQVNPDTLASELLIHVLWQCAHASGDVNWQEDPAQQLEEEARLRRYG